MSTEELNEIKKFNENVEWLKTQSIVGELRMQLLRVDGGATNKKAGKKVTIDKDALLQSFKQRIKRKRSLIK